MIRPSIRNTMGRSRLGTAIRATGCLGVLALLSACAGGQHISSQDAGRYYAEHAQRNYSVPGSASDPWGPYVREASSRFDVPERWIREVMRVESGGHAVLNGSPITSPAGAMGLMQVMPATYEELRSQYSLGDDPYDPHNSILAGAAYIRELYDLYGSPGFLAAYNSGPGRLDDYLTRNRPLPDETRRYVAMIGPRIADAVPNRRSTAEQYAMNTLPPGMPAGPRYSASQTQVAAYTPPPAPARTPAPTTPVEVAYAPPSNDDAAFDPPPGWKPPSRSQVAAYVPPPAEPAPQRVEAPAAPPQFTPAPVPHPVDADAYVPPPPAPPPAPTMVATAEPPRPRQPVQQFAALPAPPAYIPPPPESRFQTASADAPTQHRVVGFRLVAPAMAASNPYYRGTKEGAWAIQVGAFGNEGMAQSAVGSAKAQAGGVLAAAHPAVASVREPHGVLYRCPPDRPVARRGHPGLPAPEPPHQLHRAVARSSILTQDWPDARLALIGGEDHPSCR